MRLSDTPSMLLLVFVAVVDEMITAPEPIGQCAARSSSLAGMIGTSAAKRQTIHACQVIKKSILDVCCVPRILWMGRRISTELTTESPGEFTCFYRNQEGLKYGIESGFR